MHENPGGGGKERCRRLCEPHLVLICPWSSSSPLWHLMLCNTSGPLFF